MHEFWAICFSMFPYFDMLIEKRDPQINGAEIYARD